MQPKDYSHILGRKQGKLIAVDITRIEEQDVTKSGGKRMRNMITAICECGGTVTIRAASYHAMNSCGCGGTRNKYVRNADIKKRKEKFKVEKPLYEPCTVNGVSLAEYLEVYREMERREREKDTRQLFCHQVDTNIAIGSR